MNITVCEFPEGSNWDELPNWLDCLKEEIQNPKARGTGWLFSIEPSSGAKPDLEIVRGSAPQDSRKNEAVAFVARRNENDLPIPPPPFVDLAGEPHCKFDGHEHIFYYPARGMYAVTAHCRPDDDDSAVEGALHDLLASVTEINPGTTTVHFQFSATSGTVPPIYAFIEVVRAFGEWRAQRQRDHEPPLRLVLYIQSDVELCLTSGRIDIPELLASGLIRFWAVVVSIKGQEPVRRAILCRPDTTVAEVLRDVGVPVDSRSWFVSICPSPRKEPSKKRTADEVRNLKIGQIGIAFGSVLILEYDEQGNPEER
jgi:hypothetical protein